MTARGGLRAGADPKPDPRPRSGMISKSLIARFDRVLALRRDCLSYAAIGRAIGREDDPSIPISRQQAHAVVIAALRREFFNSDARPAWEATRDLAVAYLQALRHRTERVPQKPPGRPGPKRRFTEMKRFQLRLGTDYLARIDAARVLLPSAVDRPLSRAEFFRSALPGFIAELQGGLPFQAEVVGHGAQHFPLELPEALRSQAEAVVVAGLAPSLSELIRAAGGWMAELAGLAV